MHASLFHFFLHINNILIIYFLTFQYYPASLDNLEVSTLVTTITPTTVSNTTNSQVNIIKQYNTIKNNFFVVYCANI